MINIIHRNYVQIDVPSSGVGKECRLSIHINGEEMAWIMQNREQLTELIRIAEIARDRLTVIDLGGRY